MNAFNPWTALAGGALIGLAASLLLLTHGRVAGISGIVGGFLRPPGPHERDWRLAFLAGLFAAGPLLALLWPRAVASPAVVGPAWLIPAGLLVGFGTRLGSGCTSGHGICGVSRLSPRSLVATATFMVTGVLAVFVTRHWMGVTP